MQRFRDFCHNILYSEDMRKFKLFVGALALLSTICVADLALAESGLDMPPPPLVPQNDYESRPPPVIAEPKTERGKAMRKALKYMYGIGDEMNEAEFEFDYQPSSGGCNSSHLTQ